MHFMVLRLVLRSVGSFCPPVFPKFVQDIAPCCEDLKSMGSAVRVSMSQAEDVHDIEMVDI